MKIVGVEMKDAMGVRFFQLDSSAMAVVEITGKHGAGKSSVLRMLAAALSPKRHAPKEPVREGAEKGSVKLDIGEFEKDWTVRMIWDADGRPPRLDVKSKDGGKHQRATVDDWISDVMLEPLSILSKSAQERRKIFLEAFGINVDALDVRRSQIYHERTLVGRERDNAVERLKASPIVEDAEALPSREVSVHELGAELKAAVSQKSINDGYRAEEKNARESVASLRKQLAAAEKRLKVAEEKCAGLEDPDIDGIQLRINEADQLNRRIRQAADRRMLEAAASQKIEAYNDLTRSIQNLDDEKQRLLEGANVPIPGLTVGDEDLLLNGIPFSQINTAAQIPLSVAICAALRPKLNIAIVRNGNDLDQEAAAAFYDSCAKAGIEQVWIERRFGTREDSIVIEEGVYSDNDEDAE